MDPLDSPLQKTKDIQGLYIKLLWLFVGGILSFLAIEALRSELPPVFVTDQKIEISIVGLLILIATILIIYFSTKYINQLNEQRRPILVALFAGIFIYVLDFTFKILQQLIHYPVGQEIDLVYFAKKSLFFGVIGFFFSNNQVRRIRGQNSTWALWVSIFILISLSYFLSKSNFLG